MPKFEKYLRLDPSGELRWITIDRDRFLEDLYETIGTSSVEHVQLMHGLECIVDELGYYHDHQRANLHASPLYAGWIRGVPLVGAVVFVRTGLDEYGDYDWFPLLPGHIRTLEHRLGVDIPDPDQED